MKPRKTVTKSMTLEINDYSEEVLAELDKVLDLATEDIGINAQKFAVGHISGQYDVKDKAVDTGNLRRSITYATRTEEDKHKIYLGTNVDYAIYVELGTGDQGKGTGKKWIYYDKTRGQFVRTSGMRKRPFIRPAIEQHTQFYRALLLTYLQGDN